MRSVWLALILLFSPPVWSAQDLAEIITSSHRTPEFAARDRYRHPQATLAFFGVQPDHDIVEIWPAPGYYTEILAPYLRAKGRYYAASFAISQKITPQWRQEAHAEYLEKFSADPLYNRVTITEAGPLKAWTVAPPESADRVLTFRNVHNWMKGDYEAEMFAAFFKALKPGGVLGVVEHRANPGTSRAKMVESGYVTEAYVIEQAERAGFKLQARSAVNANPRDSKDHPKGVWTLPPSLRLGDVDREKYLAIGESDRMTLKFVKPD